MKDAIFCLKIWIVSKVEELNVLSEILGFELVDKAGENYILISKEEDLIAKINFVNKFGDKTDLQINVKKILDWELWTLTLLLNRLKVI